MQLRGGYREKPKGIFQRALERCWRSLYKIGHFFIKGLWVRLWEAWLRFCWRGGFKEALMRKNLWRDYGADPKDQPDFTSHDARFADKTLMQKKIMIVEREMNLQGMGKYQVS